MFDELKESYCAFIDYLFKETKRGQGFPIHVFESKIAIRLRDVYCDLIKKYTGYNYFGLDHQYIGIAIFRKIIELSQNKVSISEQLDSIYSELEFSVTNMPHRNRAWTYLHEFDCEIDRIDFPGSLRIRKATLLELALFEQSGESKASYSGHTKMKYVIETKPDISILMNELDESRPIFKSHGKVMQHNPIYKPEFYDLAAILRIMKPSWVGISDINYDFPDEHKSGYSQGLAHSSLPELYPGVENPYIPETCKLTLTDIEYLKKLLRKFRQFKGMKEKRRLDKFQRSMKRFNTAIISNSLEDMIVDLVIGLEILFSTTGFRMVYYVSNFVGLDDVQVGDIVKILDDAYNIRSKIVHGGSLDARDRDTILKTMKIMSRVLVSVIVLNDTNLEETIEKCVYNQSYRRKLRIKLKKWNSDKFDWSSSNINE